VSPYRLLSSHGIKGPRPLPLAGNFLSIRKVGHNEFLEEQIKKFGLIFGYYVGRMPMVNIADVEVLKEIMVKEFDTFSDRGLLRGPANVLRRGLGISLGLVGVGGDTWRTSRTALTPSFSGMKMKLMVPLLNKSSDVLVEKLGEFAESGKSVEMFRVYGAFTMETLIATAFGRYVNIQRGEADQITQGANSIFRAAEDGSPNAPDVLMALLSTFPWLEPLVVQVLLRMEISSSLRLINSTAISLIQARIESKEPPQVKDLLQLMLDATEGDSATDKKMTKEQLAGFSIDFLLAGYETTANTLSYTTYLLAMNPDVQEKLQAEIDQYFEEDPEASLYEAAQKLKYLDMVIHESMRLYTPVPKTQRHCMKTITIGGVTIPKGAIVVIPIDAIHHLRKYWPDPYKFDPERFTAEAKSNRPQLAHMPFGWGPRNCIGLRFALLQTKIALMEILGKYSFSRGPETPVCVAERLILLVILLIVRPNWSKHTASHLHRKAECLSRLYQEPRTISSLKTTHTCTKF
jgi:thromboxane-A synthase